MNISVWLIEVPFSNLCLGLCKDKLITVTFTDDRAMRFASKEAAEKYLQEHNVFFQGCTIHEHSFDTSLRWFYSLPANYNSANIFQTSEYGQTQGYATKREAIQAALTAVTDRIRSNTNTVLTCSEAIPKLANEQMRLLDELEKSGDL